ncbi:hypothetical protein FYM98_02275 [Lactobacillus salivarius]|uniref:hypothetical protein n=1 Tax=Ligilactobacillus salivarius TaxID=1624 RepID=UPI001368D5B2|nr:hypothetical protein [Ligilactobacillus salivarius]MYU57895.1 hypothetical protein [Ligilactobacillus salivarius]
MEEKVKRTLVLPKVLYERLEVKANEMGITVNSLILYHIYEMIDDYYDEFGTFLINTNCMLEFRC